LGGGDERQAGVVFYLGRWPFVGTYHGAVCFWCPSVRSSL
jgi:hypothetical protein